MSKPGQRKECTRCGRIAVVDVDSGQCRPCVNKQSLDEQYAHSHHTRRQSSELPEPTEYSSPFLSSRAPIDGDISAVWVYWAGGAKNDELRYSLRSAEKNLDGISNYVICGDVPSWFLGDAIPMGRFLGGGTKRKWFDSIAKLQAIIDSPLVTERFVWLYDDTFFVKPIHVCDLYEPLAAGYLSPHGGVGSWARLRNITAQMLIAADMPHHDYSTHCPIVYEKSRLQKTIDEFRCKEYPALIESLYCNQWHRNPRHIRGWFSYQKRPRPKWEIPAVPIINVGELNNHAAGIIKPMFPNRAASEVRQCQLSL